MTDSKSYAYVICSFSRNSMKSYSLRLRLAEFEKESGGCFKIAQGRISELCPNKLSDMERTKRSSILSEIERGDYYKIILTGDVLTDFGREAILSAIIAGSLIELNATEPTCVLSRYQAWFKRYMIDGSTNVTIQDSIL